MRGKGKLTFVGIVESVGEEEARVRIFPEFCNALKGINGFSERRGRHRKRAPDKKTASDKERIKRLEAENAYLKEENDFLAKIRAKRAE